MTGEVQTQAEHPRERSGGLVVAVISAKGGSGTTAVAANLAGLIALEAGQRVALLELDTTCGQLQRLFRLVGDPLLPVLAAEDRLTPDALTRLADPRPGRVSVIAAPSYPPRGMELGSKLAGELVQGLARVSDTVIADLGHRLGPAEAATLNRADAVLLVVDLSDLGVHASFGLRGALTERGIRRVIPVYNRTEANSDIDPEVLRQALGPEAGVHLPYDPVVISRCMNRGELFVRVQPASPAARRLRTLAGMLVTMPEPGAEATDPPEDRAGGDHGLSRVRPRLFGLLDRAP